MQNRGHRHEETEEGQYRHGADGRRQHQGHRYGDERHRQCQDAGDGSGSQPHGQLHQRHADHAHDGEDGGLAEKARDETGNEAEGDGTGAQDPFHGSEDGAERHVHQFRNGQRRNGFRQDEQGTDHQLQDPRHGKSGQSA